MYFLILGWVRRNQVDDPKKAKGPNQQEGTPEDLWATVKALRQK